MHPIHFFLLSTLHKLGEILTLYDLDEQIYPVLTGPIVFSIDI